MRKISILHTPQHYVLQFFIDWAPRSEAILSRMRQLSMKQSLQQTSKVEPEKVIAERVNGWAAMLGVSAAVGAYLTTGQIIPGII